MVGLIATIEVTKTVTSSLSAEEIDAIEAEVIENFDVSSDELLTQGNL